MGLLSTIIQQEFESKRQQKQLEMEGFKSLLSNPEAKPELKQQALAALGKSNPKFKPILEALGPRILSSGSVKAKPGKGESASEFPVSAGQSGFYSHEEEDQRALAMRAAERQQDFQYDSAARKLQTKLDSESKAQELQHKVDLITQTFNDPNKPEQLKQTLIGTIGGNAARGALPKPPKWTAAWVQKPGEKLLTKVWEEPGTNNRIYVDSGEPVDENTPTVDPSQVSTEARKEYWGEFGNYYRAAMGQGHSDEDSKAIAGKMVFNKYGISIGKTEQDMALKTFLSGVPGGSDLGSTKGGAPKGAAPSEGAPSGGGAPNRTNVFGPRAETDRAQHAVNETRYMNMYLSSLFGNTPAGRGGAAGQVGIQRGMESVQKLTGLDPVAFQTMAVVNKDKAKGIGDTIQRYVAVQRLTELMDGFGANVIETGQKAIATGSPVLNQAWRSISTRSVGNPEIRQYLLALNALQRQYSVLTAGGALSRAMLPVSVAESVDKLLSPDATLAEAIASVSQLKTETKIEKDGYQRSISDAALEINTSFGGKPGEGQKPSGTTPKTIHFVEGSDHWEIPEDQVEAFKQKHKNAKAQ